MGARRLNEIELSDILDGATILAAGGGGPVQAGKAFLKSMISEKSMPQLLPWDEITDDLRVTVPVAMGSCATLLEDFLDFQMVRALEIFQKQAGKVDAIIPVETGQVNTLAVLYVGAKSGIPVIDGDGTGRSIPELKNTVFYSAKINMYPFVMFDSLQNQVVLDARSPEDVDRLGRTICTEMGGLCGVCGFDISGAEVKKIAVPKTVSECERLGKVLRENFDGDPVKALVKERNGFLLIRGKISKLQSKVLHGHDYGNMLVEGFGSHKGNVLNVAFKNEGLITYLNKKPVVISPDHVFVLDLLTHKPVTFTDAVEGLPVAVVGLKVDAKRRTPQDYDGFRASLHDVGYDGEYVPIEELAP
jgi:uncharacterized protein